MENAIMFAISLRKREREIRGWVLAHFTMYSLSILLFGTFYTTERRINKEPRYLSDKFSALRCSKAKERRDKNMNTKRFPFACPIAIAVHERELQPKIRLIKKREDG